MPSKELRCPLPMQEPAPHTAESTFSSVRLSKAREFTVNKAFCLLTHPWKCCFPSSWHHKVASSAISESREEPFFFFFNTLSFCLGQDVLIYNFLVIHKPEKDPGCFRGGMHEALSHRESLLCQILILHQKHVLLVFWEDFFFFFFFFSVLPFEDAPCLGGGEHPKILWNLWVPEPLMWDLGLELPGVLISVDLLILEEKLNQVCNQYGGLSRMLRNNQKGKASHRLLQEGGFLRGSLKAHLFFPSLVYLLPWYLKNLLPQWQQ